MPPHQESMVDVEGKWAINDLKQTLEQRGTEPQEDTNVWIRYNPALSYPGDEIEDERKFGEADQRQVVHDFLRKAEIGILAIDATLWSDGWLENVTFPRQVLLLQNADPLKLPHFEPRHLAFLWKVRRLVIDVPWNHVAVMCLPPVNPLKRYLVYDGIASHTVMHFFEGLYNLTHLCIRINVGRMAEGACPVTKWLHEIVRAKPHLSQLVLQCVDDVSGSPCSRRHHVWRLLNQYIVSNKLRQVNLIPFAMKLSDEWHTLGETGEFALWEKARKPGGQLRAVLNMAGLRPE
ncbi:predicted protein [Postia placenta Mad-698-R]|uniref:Uncharacterized protein n=1 Tax=Postia placenta MAD-698-R-SB12 TaxID=670580 RepID=A0A1X6MXW7_9APHY|nr:hypothetical protein POSPLADRAFT_1047453 [Postia placenta MAD-698-R-SB12]EED80731.1 predicted protein [Postia placenta Mad-698-R]OSX61208.1 hypothetical protein POSPLADRAFT_1047453 [Postia placenta MAD-698-R-SB12]